MKHYLEDIQVNPLNQYEYGIKSVFSNTITDLQLSPDNIKLSKEDYKRVQDKINQTGLFEGAKYTIKTDGVPSLTLNYIADFRNAVFTDYDIEIPITKDKGIDDFINEANGTSFRLMASKGVVFPTIQTPYVIVKDSQAETALSTGVMLYVMTEALANAIYDLADATAQLIQATTPNIGVPPSIDLGDVIALSIKVIAQIAKVAVLGLAVKKLGEQARELIFPKIRFYNAVSLFDLLNLGCQFLGFQFSSTIPELKREHVVPKPLKKQTKKWFEYLQNELNLAFNESYPTESGISTLGNIIDAVLIKFNGRIREINGTIHIERRDYWQSTASLELKKPLIDQERGVSQYRYNTDEAWKRYYLSYQTDISDLHTYDSFDSVDCEYSAEPVGAVNLSYVKIQGNINLQIPFALGARKNELNWLENLVLSVFQFIDSLLDIFGVNSSLASGIENRIGVMQISQQYFETTKLLYLVGTKQPENYLTKIGANAIYQKYHSINQIENNGYKIFENAVFDISQNDLISLLNNNFVIIDGLICELIEFEYIEENSKLIATYKEPNNYAQGKVKTILIDG